MFHYLDGNNFFALNVPVDCSPGEKKRVSTLCCSREVYTKILPDVSCVIGHKVCCPEAFFIIFFFLFNLIDGRNSSAGIARISLLTILKKKSLLFSVHFTVSTQTNTEHSLSLSVLGEDSLQHGSNV